MNDVISIHVDFSKILFFIHLIAVVAIFFIGRKFMFYWIKTILGLIVFLSIIASIFVTGSWAFPKKAESVLQSTVVATENIVTEQK